MELPKNITQIGESDRNCKIYVEDYVISYIKQLNQSARDKDMAVALYGVRKEEKDTAYIFLYGASKLDFLQKESRHLSQAQRQEIEKFRKKYFPEYRFLGYRLLNGEMVEGFHICEQETCRYISGYAQFYEKNDCMLAYMLDARQEEVKPEVVPQEKYDMVKQRQEERRTLLDEQSAGTGRSSAAMRKMRISAVAVFALLCIAGLATVGGSDKLENLQVAAKQMVEDMTQQKLPDSIEVMNSGAQVEVIVAEDKLAQALQQENQNAGVSSEPVPLEPVQSETDVAETVPQPSAENEGNSAVQPAAGETGNGTEQQPLGETGNGTEQQPLEETENSTTQQPSEIQPANIAPESQPEPEAVSYTIKQGDTLIGICISRYGSDSRVKEICTLNRISNPDDIKIGEKILLP